MKKEEEEEPLDTNGDQVLPSASSQKQEPEIELWRESGAPSGPADDLGSVCKADMNLSDPLFYEVDESDLMPGTELINIEH